MAGMSLEVPLSTPQWQDPNSNQAVVSSPALLPEEVQLGSQAAVER